MSRTCPSCGAKIPVRLIWQWRLSCPACRASLAVIWGKDEAFLPGLLSAKAVFAMLRLRRSEFWWVGLLGLVVGVLLFIQFWPLKYRVEESESPPTESAP